MSKDRLRYRVERQISLVQVVDARRVHVHRTQVVHLHGRTSNTAAEVCMAALMPASRLCHRGISLLPALAALKGPSTIGAAAPFAVHEEVILKRSRTQPSTRSLSSHEPPRWTATALAKLSTHVRACYRQAYGDADHCQRRRECEECAAPRSEFGMRHPAGARTRRRAPGHASATG